MVDNLLIKISTYTSYLRRFHTVSGQETAFLVSSIHGHLTTGTGEPGLARLDTMVKYYFDGEGKTLRPALTLAMAAACNHHLQVLAW